MKKLDKKENEFDCIECSEIVQVGLVLVFLGIVCGSYQLSGQ